VNGPTQLYDRRPALEPGAPTIRLHARTFYRAGDSDMHRPLINATYALFMSGAACVSHTDCPSRSALDCGDDGTCATIKAVAAERLGCMPEPRNVGCIEANTPCDESTSYARDPDGKQWAFSTTCIPNGWTAIQLDASSVAPCELPAAACDQLDRAACEATAACTTIMAFSLDTSECSSEPVVVGCMASDKPCGEAQTYARDAAGKHWLFGTTCIPANWVPLDEEIQTTCSGNTTNDR